MQTINSKSADDAAGMQKQNPSEAPNRLPSGRMRVPMTTPLRKLEVQEIPGYHLQWIKGSQERISQALNAGFEFVDYNEVSLNNMDLGGDGKMSGNTDMGSRVSCGEGSGEIENGQSIRLFLMKQRKDYFDEDRALLQRRNDSVVDSLTAQFRQGTVGLGAEGAPAETSEDVKQRYVGSQTKIPDLFKRKPDRSQ